MKTAPLFILLLALAGPVFSADEISPTLTLVAARDLAVRTHPRMTLAQLRSLVAREVVTETRSGFFPTIAANATGVESGEQVTRIASGQLSNSQIFDHTGIGLTLSLLVTDFGRTENLTEAAKLRARAADADALATRAQLLLEVDAAYFSALNARSLKQVAAETLSVRQTLFSRASALAQNQLRSDLDVRFARVAVDEARLFISNAEKNWQASLVTLGNLLGAKTSLGNAQLEDPPVPAALPGTADDLVTLAQERRPEILRQRAGADAARATARAARDSRLPTVSIAASVGIVPTSDPHFEHDYAAGGLNVNLPLFAGGLYRARQREAELQAQSADAALEDQSNNISRDVRLAWLEATNARERIALTQSLLENSSAALDLARGRFEQGMSSTIELTQAELAQTSAEIAHTTADYDYRLRREILDYQTGSLK